MKVSKLNAKFLEAIPVLQKIIDAGYEAYFVGGSVRDSLLNREITDIDIASSALPEEIKLIFPKTFDVGIEHGTVVVLHNNQTYEITTFRTESTYKNFRRPETVNFVRSLQEDLKRRDFTMNAMALTMDGTIVDYFNGQAHLKEKMIQTVGNAKDRFQEDALRMLRAVRFASQLGFFIEENTMEAIRDRGHLLEHISVERKLTEFNKLLDGPYINQGINYLVNTSIYTYLPQLQQFKDSLMKLAELSLNDLTLVEKWTILLYVARLSEEETARFLTAWKQPTKVIKQIKQLLKWLNFRETLVWDSYHLYTAQLHTVISVEKIRSVLSMAIVDIDSLNEMYDQLPIKSRDEIVVSGKDIIAWAQRRQGPWVREIIEAMECAIINKQLLNQKSEIEVWVHQCLLK